MIEHISLAVVIKLGSSDELIHGLCERRVQLQPVCMNLCSQFVVVEFVYPVVAVKRRLTVRQLIVRSRYGRLRC